jgi:hypothetical protein
MMAQEDRRSRPEVPSSSTAHWVAIGGPGQGTITRLASTAAAAAAAGHSRGR